MRVSLRRLVVALIAVLLVVGGGLLGRELWQQRRVDLARQALELLPGVAQRIQDFRRVGVVGGRVAWEVSAREAQYLEEEGVVVVQEPLVEIHLEDGRIVALRGREGRVFLGERDVRRVDVEGDIAVQLGEYALEAEFAYYEAARQVIVAPGAVRITSTQLDLRGEGMEIEVESQQLSVARDVHVTLWPRT